MVGVRWLRLRRLFTSAKTRPTNRLQALLPIAAKEGKLLDEPSGGGHATADRKWLLDTYAECLRTVQNPSSRERPERIVALTTGGSFMVLCMVIPHLKKPIPNPPVERPVQGSPIARRAGASARCGR